MMAHLAEREVEADSPHLVAHVEHEGRQPHPEEGLKPHADPQEDPDQRAEQEHYPGAEALELPDRHGQRNIHDHQPGRTDRVDGREAQIAAVHLGEQDRRQADRHQEELEVVRELPAQVGPEHPEGRVVEDARRVAQRLPPQLPAGHSVKGRRGQQVEQADFVESPDADELKQREDRQNERESSARGGHRP